jgi:c-di-GMP-binding flagellar brake protein YcgR
VEERRSSRRVAARIPVKFRVVREKSGLEVSQPVLAHLRDISRQGMAMETAQIVVDGFHISYDHHPSQRNRLYLQMELPGMGSLKAVGETIWYERIPGSQPLFAVGIRFVEMTGEDREKLLRFLRERGD